MEWTLIQSTLLERGAGRYTQLIAEDKQRKIEGLRLAWNRGVPPGAGLRYARCDDYACMSFKLKPRTLSLVKSDNPRFIRMQSDTT